MNTNLQLDSVYSYMSSKYPDLKVWWEGVRNWPITLFYIMAETWGTLMLSMSFWGFVNEISSSDQAKRSYPFLTAGAAIGTILAGVFIKLFEKDTYINLLTVCVLIICIMLCYNYLAGKIRNYPNEYEIEVQRPVQKKKKLSLLQSIKMSFTSSYFFLFISIILAYNIFIVLLESVWKGNISAYKKLLCSQYTQEGLPDAKQLSEQGVKFFYFLQNIFVGTLSLFFILFVSSRVSRKRWLSVAVFTPIVATVMSIILIFFYYLIKFTSIFNVSSVNSGFFSQLISKYPPVFFFIMIGLLVLVFIKSSKYVFFDTSKERLMVPLSPEDKFNIKNAGDGVGSRLGKGLTSIFVTFLDTVFSSRETVEIICLSLISIVLVYWFVSVIIIEPLYEKKLEEAKARNIENKMSDGQTVLANEKYSVNNEISGDSSATVSNLGDSADSSSTAEVDSNNA